MVSYATMTRYGSTSDCGKGKARINPGPQALITIRLWRTLWMVIVLIRFGADYPLMVAGWSTSASSDRRLTRSS